MKWFYFPATKTHVLVYKGQARAVVLKLGRRFCFQVSNDRGEVVTHDISPTIEEAKAMCWAWTE